MTLGIRGKLFAISLGLIGVAALTSGVLVETLMRRLLLEQVSDELARSGLVVREAIELMPAPFERATLQAIAERLGQAAAARVTVVAPSGVVLADSSVSFAELSRIDNHGLRPEVRAAVKGGRGVSTRYSTTVHANMMYLAVPFQRPEQGGVVRVSMSLSKVEALISQMRWLLTGAVLVGLLIAMMMGALASYFASRSLMELVARARTVASGARGARLDVHGDTTELAGLAGSFNRMADELDRAIESLAVERDRSAAILESLTDAVLALDAKTQVTQVNRSAMRLLGLDQPPHDSPLIDVVRVPALLEVAEKARAGETAHTEVVLPGPPRRVLSATAAPQRAQGHCVLVLRDVTELRRLETMRRDFVANVSHELRTPVSVISANVETLISGALSDPGRAEEFLRAVQRNAERLSRLVNDLLDLSRIEAGGHVIALADVSPEGPIGAVVDLLETRAADKHIAFEVAADEDLVVRGDGSSLEHVLVNLVENAIKYTPGGGRVGLEVKRDGMDVLFEVWDTGPGVPESHRARLFERFYRVDPGRSRDMGGTGLGLSIVKHLVESMRGSVGMHARAGGGSVFWVRLPAADSASAAEVDATA